jgi:DNA-binding MarR family transcriptional regulator
LHEQTNERLSENQFTRRGRPLSLSATTSARLKKAAALATADADLAAALAGLGRLVEAVRRSERVLEQELGLSGARLYILRLLRSRPAQSLSDLAARTGTHQSTVSVVVSRLVAHGLVAREVSADDARRVTLALTPAGRALVRRAPLPVEEHLATALAQLTRRNLRVLAEGLGQLTAKLDGARAPGEPPAGVLEEPPLRPRLARRDRRHSR